MPTAAIATAAALVAASLERQEVHDMRLALVIAVGIVAFVGYLAYMIHIHNRPRRR